MDWQHHSLINPAVCGGRPAVRGTRVPVETVLGAFAAGDSVDEVCQAYTPTTDQVRACLAFAAHEIAEGTYIALPH